MPNNKQLINENHLNHWEGVNAMIRSSKASIFV